ncbi:MAG: guanine deaminase [Lachnospiraceae bacterium]|nr:guanine deaminase [Lachnospiraceae bacterium]
MSDIFALKGDIAFSTDIQTIETRENHYLVCKDGKVEGVFDRLPEEFKDIPVTEYKNSIIIPGLSDLHVHAPQYSYRGLNMDLELLEWLNTNTFPEESKFKDLEYAKRSYEIFVEDMRKSATTRAVVFATIHTEATRLLMDLFETSGVKAMVGKVNMDRNSPEYLIETTEDSANDTLNWILETANKYQNVKPIITPRFIPTCTDELMAKLGEIQRKTKVPMQSHLSENLDEIAWVKELCPDAEFYGDAYDKHGLFGGECKTVMAHCVYSTPEEVERMKERGVYVAHCPQSNMNVASGISPVRRLLESGLKVGLGSDVAGGSSLSLFRAMTDAIQCSKLYYRIMDQSAKQLTIEEAFYMGTMGGGEFFGKVGTFLKGYAFDVVVLNEEDLPHPQEFNLKQRLERMVYLSDDRHITAKYVEGNKLF